MVIDRGAFLSGDYGTVFDEIVEVKDACGAAHLKVILETALLTDDEKVKACVICKAAGADFVKTSTGFSKGGATVEDVALMARTVAPRKLGVKASGGIRAYADVVKMVEAEFSMAASELTTAPKMAAKKMLNSPAWGMAGSKR